MRTQLNLAFMLSLIDQRKALLRTLAIWQHITNPQPHLLASFIQVSKRDMARLAEQRKEGNS